MNSKNLMKSLLGLAFTLASGVVLATVEQTFEGPDDGTELSAANLDKWSGDGTIVAESVEIPSIGSPITNVNNSANILLLEGNVVCDDSNSMAEEDAAQIDFLMNVSEMGEDPTEDPADGEMQIALATGELSGDYAKLFLYCTPKAGEKGWAQIGTVETGKWVRVTLVFDYLKGSCRVSVNGNPIVSSLGYAKSDKFGGGDGSWYALANEPTSKKVASLTFTGLAKMDDVKVSQESLSEFSPYKADAVVPNQKVTIDGQAVEIKVTYNDLAVLGVDTITADTSAADESGMKAVEKIEAGYEMNDKKVFKPTEMTLVKEGDKQVATIKVPKPTRATPPKYTLLATGENYSQTLQTVTAADGELKFELPTGNGVPKVLKFKLKAEQAQ